MDVESFSQCIQYIQATQVKFSLDKLIPVGAALGGATIGFCLNLFTSFLKDSKSIKNKLICCEEDVEQIQKNTSILVKEICNVCIALATKQPINSHRIAFDVSSLYLNEYFAEVAHKYNRSQRESIQRTITSLRSLNSELPALIGAKMAAYDFSLLLLNVASIAMNVWSHCEDFKVGEAFQQEEEQLINSFCSTGEEIQAYQSIKKNAQMHNSRLGLETANG